MVDHDPSEATISPHTIKHYNDKYINHVYRNGMSPHSRSTQAIVTPHSFTDRSEHGKDLHLHRIQEEARKLHGTLQGQETFALSLPRRQFLPHEVKHSKIPSTLHVHLQIEMSNNTATTVDVIRPNFCAIDKAIGQNK